MPRSLPALALFASLATPAFAHFQEIIPSTDVLPEGGSVKLDLVFTHPFEGGPVMDMKKPARVGVFKDGNAKDLMDSLVSNPTEGKSAWQLETELVEPGASVFFVEPQPYWEPTEGKYIVHYAKVVVDNYASGEGWDRSDRTTRRDPASYTPRPAFGPAISFPAWC